VVTGVKQQGVWNPQYFIKAYGSTPVKLENCETGEVKDSTVGEFFLTFSHPIRYPTYGRLRQIFSPFATVVCELD